MTETAAAPRTAALEARMADIEGARAEYLDEIEIADDWGLWLCAPQTVPCEMCRRNAQAIDAASIAYDAAVSRLYDTPAHRERQLAAWAERERRALVAEVAW